MSKPSRNDPCPCGSGKKYKKCCAHKALGTRKVSVHSGGIASSFFQGAAGSPAKSLAGRVTTSQAPANDAATEVFKKEEDKKTDT